MKTAPWPGSPYAHYEIGKALGEARQYAPAAEYLNAAHERMPMWAEPVVELGLLEVQYGRLDPALAALTTAADLDPFNIRAANTLKLVRELLTYASVETEHFTVRYKPGVDEILAREMVQPLEQIYRVVTGSSGGGIDFEPEERTYIDLMPDPGDNGNLRRRNRLRDDLLIKLPQILKRPSPAPKQDQIDAAHTLPLAV